MKRLIFAVLAISVIILVSCTTTDDTNLPEYDIPPHFSTYTEPEGRFSIACPPDWEVVLNGSMSESHQQRFKELGIETKDLVFFAGLPEGSAFNPWMYIRATADPEMPRDYDIYTLDYKKIFSREYSKILSKRDTVVDGKKAIIVDVRSQVVSDIPVFLHDKALLLATASYWWMVDCAEWSSDEACPANDDFEIITRSLRVYE
ncbi:hypothetical protein ES703_23610 [subsurface metagenome]